LLTAVELGDVPRERPSPADAEHRSVIGRDVAGTAVAFGWNEPSASDVDPRRLYMGGGVHPGWRGRGIGRALLAWQLDNGRDWYATTDEPHFGPLRLITYVDAKLADRRRLYESAGLTSVRWYADLSLRLHGSAPVHEAPPGIRIVPFSHKNSEAVRQAHNEAFSDHWGSQPVDVHHWEEQLLRSASRPQWSWVALDAATSEVAGYALSSVYEQDWELQGFSEGWTDRIGVRRAWRGRGVAKALLAASIRSFADAGLAAAGLGVDSDNPGGALGLYERLGYVATDSMVMYARTEERQQKG